MNEQKEAFNRGKKLGLIIAFGEAMQVLLTIKHDGHGGGNFRRLIEMAIVDLKKRQEERLKEKEYE